MHALLEDFFQYLAAEKGSAKNTIQAYRRDLNLFSDFLAAAGLQQISELEPQHLVQFLSFLKEKSYAPATLSRMLFAVKVFCRFLKREKHLATNPSLYIDSPKLWQTLPEVLSPQEIELLLAQPNESEFEGSRDKLMLEILYASGLRVSELCGLNISDIDDTFLRVFGKGGKERIVPIGSKALQALDHYLTCHRCQFESDRQQALLLSKRGTRLTREMVWRALKKYAKQAGIIKNIFPHALRHTFATHLLDNGADLRVIQDMLGHASINSTDRYTHISRKKIQKAFHAFHPRDEFNPKK